jgi:small subunit ribosomal protein S6
MRVYETTFIINPQTDDATIDNQVKAVSNLITGNGGKILYENRMGTRRLAYTVNGLSQGYYANLIFESEPEVLPIIDRHYKLDEAYVRYLTVLYEGPSPEEMKEQPVREMPFRRHERRGGGRRADGSTPPGADRSRSSAQSTEKDESKPVAGRVKTGQDAASDSTSAETERSASPEPAASESDSSESSSDDVKKE